MLRQARSLSSYALWLFYFLCWSSFLLDLSQNGFGGVSNTRFVSFLDSFSHVSSWSSGSKDPTWVIGTVVTKYGSSLVTSALLGVLPSFLSSLSLGTFLAALFSVYSAPQMADKARERHGPWRWLFLCLGALYKARKVIFAVRRCANPVQAVMIGTVTAELTGWFNVAGRTGLGKGDPWRAVLEHVVRYRWRTLVTVAAVLVAYYDFHPFVVFALLWARKAMTSSEFGQSLMLEI